MSKTEYVEGINLENTSRFMAVAIKKIQAEVEAAEGGGNMIDPRLFLCKRDSGSSRS
jgi:hypothetical protein